MVVNKKKYIRIILLIYLFIGVEASAQQKPAPKQSKAITIEGATAHLGNGEVIENSLIMFEDGKLTFVGSAMSRIARRGEKIMAEGKHIYPGFIAPNTSLGLIEIDAVRASKDQDEIGEMIPHIRSLVAYNAESKVVESMRPNGVLLGQIAPQGGRISGTSSVVQFDAWNWEDAAVKIDDAIHLHWPTTFRKGKWWEGEGRGYQANKKYGEEVQETITFLKNAAVYDSGVITKNPVLSAMSGLFTGKQKLFVYADGEKEIIDAITNIKDAGIKQVVLVGGSHAHKVALFLKANDIPVLVGATHNLPDFDEDDYDLPYKLPKLLVDAGLLVGLQNSTASNFQIRNLPFYAGQTVSQGMEKEKALELITGNTAKILGIDAVYGTLETGKSATLIISEGDALDMKGNQLTQAFIDGREISLDTHQTELWKRYEGKYKGK
ncbi:amidohydrolase family protein [Zobellia laminariae]|uniref:amidohydrolase family protein n=1 Tax=Zobellia laminariae TaxID=248906 RepID=UPI0026F4523B|nr:amidohydrolase family protein [Zobellia laminariae]WKX76520.1 amidohydrolase family protein [Zobellia laminariae]